MSSGAPRGEVAHGLLGFSLSGAPSSFFEGGSWVFFSLLSAVDWWLSARVFLLRALRVLCVNFSSSPKLSTEN